MAKIVAKNNDEIVIDEGNSLHRKLLRSHYLVASVAIVPLLIVLCISIWVNHIIKSSSETYFERLKAEIEILESIERSNLLIRNRLLNKNSNSVQAEASFWNEKLMFSLTKLLNASQGIKDSPYQENRLAVEEILTKIYQLQSSVLKVDSENESQWEIAANTYTLEIIPLTRNLQENLSWLIDYETKMMEAEVSLLNEGIIFETMIMMLLIILTICTAHTLSTSKSKAILKPIHKLVKATQALRAGRSNSKIQVTTNDELGILTHSFNDMNEAIISRERQIKDIAQSFHGVVWVIDTSDTDETDFHFTYIGGQVKELFGYSAEELYSEPSLLHNAFHPADTGKVVKMLSNITTDSKNLIIDQRYFHPTKYLRYFKTIITPVLEEGKLTTLRGIYIDITDDVNKEQSLKTLLEKVEQSEKKMTGLVNSIDGVVIEIDYTNNKKYEFVSNQAENIFGYGPKAYHKDVNLLENQVVAEDRNKFKKLLSDQTDDKECLIADIKFTHKNKQTVYINARVTKHFDGNGDIEKLRGVLLDISEKKELEEKQLKMENQLRQAQKMESVGLLAAGIAHEINTPSQFVSDNIHFIQESYQSIDELFGKYEELEGLGKTNSQLAEKVEQINQYKEKIDLAYLREDLPAAIEQSQEGVERISTIVRAMKEFSHPGSENFEIIDLNKCIESTITVARNEWKYVAEVKTEFESMLPSIECMPGEVNQTILNIIVNSSHAIGEKIQSAIYEKGEILISTHYENNGVLIKITDNGCGIKSENLNKIFDHFFTTKDVGKGTGQGLSLVYSVIVEKHKGKLDVDSTYGESTTFSIWLPEKQTDETQEMEQQFEMAS